MPDGQPTFRGFAIKVVGVSGQKYLPEEADTVTQDFLLVNHPVIPTGTVETYLEQQLKPEKQAGLPEEVQQIQS
ncbi:hypothetical protein [Fibrella forsythiae]|uniref:Uncharacterized protein n=1 Tax=Fibrella forsythiae TaxID=2817061 RepID=A0ABS3JTK1_9BACT|nr:hypothetical protein [Fibrella forsythiae]MBO0952711.1 hypothetical protein [Fibrella forsythiae]